MKPLNPAIRERKRYLFVKGENLKENIPKAIFEFIGVLGMAKTGLKFIKSDKNSVIICINREYLDKIRASFVVYKENIRVGRVSGTLKSLG